MDWRGILRWLTLGIYVLLILIVSWSLKKWCEFGTDTAILGGLCAAGFLYIQMKLDTRVGLPSGTSVETHIDELWGYLWNPETLKHRKSSSRSSEAVTTALLDGKIRKGMTAEQIFEYLKSNSYLGYEGTYFGPSMGEDKSETYEQAFWDYGCAHPSPAAGDTIPELRLIFRTSDRVLIDWKMEYKGSLSEIVMRAKRIMELRNSQ